MREIHIGADTDPALYDLSWAKAGRTREEDEFYLVFFKGDRDAQEEPNTVHALYEDTNRCYTIEYDFSNHQVMLEIIKYHVPSVRPVRDVPDDYSRVKFYRHWTKRYLDMLDRLL